MNDPIVRIVRMTFQEHKIKEFQLLFQEVKTRILLFEGCMKVELLRDIHHTNVFATYSLWTDAESLDNYRDSDFFRETWSKTKSMFELPATAWSYKVCNEF